MWRRSSYLYVLECVLTDYPRTHLLHFQMQKQPPPTKKTSKKVTDDKFYIKKKEQHSFTVVSSSKTETHYGITNDCLIAPTNNHPPKMFQHSLPSYA